MAMAFVAMVLVLVAAVSFVNSPQAAQTVQTFQTVQTVEIVPPVQTNQTTQAVETNQTARPIPETLAVAPAAELASEVRSLPLINDSSACPSVSTAVSNSIVIMQEMGGAFGVGFHSIQFDPSNCDVAVKYVPIVGSYNELVTAARQFDPNNVTSVEVFYEDAFLLSSNMIIINDSVAYKLAFTSTGELNDALGLSTLRSLCGNVCYSAVLSGIHWTIRTYMDAFLCTFESYVTKYLPIAVKLWC